MNSYHFLSLIDRTGSWIPGSDSFAQSKSTPTRIDLKSLSSNGLKILKYPDRLNFECSQGDDKIASNKINSFIVFAIGPATPMQPQLSRGFEFLYEPYNMAI